jgi:membrane-associated phospholipid phosphatase
MTVAAIEVRGAPGDRDDARRSLAVRLAMASAAALAAAAVCYLLMVRTSLGQRFDNAAYLGATDQAGGLAANDQLRRITGDSFALVLVVLVILGAARRRLLLGLGAALAAGLAVVGTDFLKNHILTRPLLTGDLLAVGNTFPSGHTATAVACAMSLVIVSPPRWRGVAAVTAGAYAWITAAEVQTAGWHRPSDAIGAACLAFAAITAVGAALAVMRPVTRTTTVRHRVAQAVLGLVAGADLIVVAWGLFRVLGYLGDHAEGVVAPGGLREDAYVTGLAVTVGVVVVLLMILLALVGRADLGAPIAPERPQGRSLNTGCPFPGLP